MMDIPVQDVMQKLINDFGYTEQNAERAVSSLLVSASIIQKAFEQWWSDGTLDVELEVHGYTLKRLMDEYAFNPINALLTMDWLLREPDMALVALDEGYDDRE
jgi:hypothetical protein